MVDIGKHPYWVILLMALSVYSTRMLGYWLAGRFRFNHIIKTWLGYLPGCILMAIVGPTLITSSPIEYLAAGVVVLFMWRFNNLLLAMLVGIAIVVIYRVFM